MKAKAKKIKAKKTNPYPKYSYNTGLQYLNSDKPMWGIDLKWFMWEIKHRNGLPKI